MDVATIIGTVVTVTLILLAMESPMAFLNVPSLLIVVGGTAGATLIANPLSDFIGGVSIYKKAF